MEKEIKEIDLDKPKDARKFLRGIRIQGNTIDHVKLANGKTLKVEEMDESQIVFYAKEIYFEFMGGVEDEVGIVDLEGVDQ